MPGGSSFANDHWNDRRAETPFTSPPLDDDFDAITQRWSRTTRATTVEPTASGLYEQLEAVTHGSTPFTAPRRRKKTEHREFGDWSAQKHESGAGVAPGRSRRRTRAKDRIKSGLARGAPVAGQDYELVECRLLEEGAERTVSISTWREQAIQEADSDDDMSVYYVNAEDCARIEEKEIGAAADFVSPPTRTKDGSNNSGQRSGESSKGPQRHQHASTSAEKLNGRPSTSRNNSGTKTYRSGSKEGASPTLHSSAPRTSTPRDSSTLVLQLPDSPADNFKPFHATHKSGSTISSIHLTPAPTLKNVLESCQPSLTHISPLLQRVGIVRAEHLRAVGKLSEDTRNREIREEVLKLGVTVVEWAILLDRLRDL
ncbi:hypothetical protein B0H17DRAFT_1038937 [Mycena rosella]|uniref:Uncharacterized protein n=1 Tax=Mycena rosella TaxID=1033263 RepID=A0AAD7GTJ9_MYCRO|nr:hypothetical protein B0H17DRAFT_1038937 [Mycena rosella]